MVTQSKSLYKAPRTTVSQDQGKFRIHFNFPGRNHPDHDDHGYGPLATVVESFMDPDTLIGMHPHRNEEIISWVPDGVMRHDDRQGNELVTDPDHLLVMNAGREFWHEERTLAEDPPLRMLQIFVRPHSLGLEPTIQHEPIPTPVDGEWRHLFGPEGTTAPAYVRNQVHCHDVRLPEGASVEFPTVEGWDTYFYVFDGAVAVAGTDFDRAESGLLVSGGETITATSDAVVVAFSIDPTAPVTRQGTIGR
ncbi:pirin family protein [Halomicroarcula sp. F28]|uniref:Pirin family protein n=1 Tax=Haloarcula salinisoli TaxID=2487746 RepID=A0A8J8C8W8_9EURY|nr:pirin family protein [Halomicroarcula salinisoli]MBX0303584.1 pirin family protein [Halomicroarcula salinisoli]